MERENLWKLIFWRKKNSIPSQIEPKVFVCVRSTVRDKLATEKKNAGGRIRRRICVSNNNIGPCVHSGPVSTYDPNNYHGICVNSRVALSVLSMTKMFWINAKLDSYHDRPHLYPPHPNWAWIRRKERMTSDVTNHRGPEAAVGGVSDTQDAHNSVLNRPLSWWLNEMDVLSTNKLRWPALIWQLLTLFGMKDSITGCYTVV